MTLIQKAILIATKNAEKDNYGRQVVRIDKLIPELTELLPIEKQNISHAFYSGKANEKNFDDYFENIEKI